jgi:hypothetical protein
MTRGQFGVAAAASLGGMRAAGDVLTGRIFGSEIQTGPYKHPVLMSELAGGDQYPVYYGGAGEYAVEPGAFDSRKRKGEATWSTPQRIAGNPFWPVGNGVVWQAPDGIVWLFFVTRFGERWLDSRMAAKISRDGAHTWSDASPLTFELGGMVRGRPIVLDDGDYLLPIYHESGHDTELAGAESASSFLCYDVKTKRRKETGRIRSKKGNIRPSPASLGSHHGTTERTPLTVAISTGNDKNYPHGRNIAEGLHDYGHPLAFQASDGKIHVVYTSGKRQVIRHAMFDESAIVR